MTKSKPLDTYVVRVGEALVGPVTLDQLRRGIQAGKVPETAEAKPVEGVDWKPVTQIVLRFELPPPRLPPQSRLPEPSWSALGEVVTPNEAPPLPSTAKQDEAPSATEDAVTTAPTRTFDRPSFMVFVPGSQDPPSGPFKATTLKARLEQGLSPPNAQVCVVDETALWIPIGRLFEPE